MAAPEDFLEKSITDMRKRKEREKDPCNSKKENILNGSSLLITLPEKKRRENPPEVAIPEQKAETESTKKPNKRNQRRRLSRLKGKLEDKHGQLPVPFANGNADDKRTPSPIITARECDLVFNNDPFQGAILTHHKAVIEKILRSDKILGFSASKKIDKTIGFIDYISEDGHQCTLIAVSGIGQSKDPKNSGFILDNLLKEELPFISKSYHDRDFLYVSDFSVEALSVIQQLKAAHQKQGANPQYICAEDKLASEILKKNKIKIEGEHYFAIKTPTLVNKIPSCRSCLALKVEYERRRSEHKPFTPSPQKAITFFARKRVSQPAEPCNTAKRSISFELGCSVET